MWVRSISFLLLKKRAFAPHSIDFFTAQCAAAHAAVDVWCLMVVRINSKVNRDIRKKIVMLTWEAREQADYVIEPASKDRSDHNK